MVSQHVRLLSQFQHSEWFVIDQDAAHVDLTLLSILRSVAWTRSDVIHQSH